ncbi:MAG: hypothetical protein J5503_04640 [Muribaculaceae bacterium]|nr:hypothetical protein [Muribaculaceae bacterium]
MKGIITGDIVDSSQIKPQYRGELLNCLSTMEEDLQCISPFKMEMFRGDSFQLLIEDPCAAMRIAILLRAGLIHHTVNKEDGIWDARISLGIGNVEFLSEKIVTSDGEAFQYSGRQLDIMGKQRLAVKTPWKDANEELELSTSFIDDIINGWSSKQAGLIYLTLRQDTPKKEVAQLIGTSVQNVRNVLSSAKEHLVRKYLDRYHEIINSHQNNA